MQEFQTSKHDYSEYRIVEVNSHDLSEGEVRAKIDRFAFTANNITYAVAGERIRYWDFFPPQGDKPSNWGIIPVWGFADIVESQCQELPVGERLFGYFLPSQELIMRPASINQATFIEASAHRAELPIGYNVYQRVSNEENYAPQQDDQRMLLYVLHLTAFCIQEMLRKNDWFAAEQILVISASSKTSSGLGFGLVNDKSAPTAIGLTSNKNLSLVESMQAYDQALSYDDIESIDASKATVIVDMSGNVPLLSKLHQRLADNMRFTCKVGLTHWDQAAELGSDSVGMINDRSKMFFAPAVIQQGIQELGQQEWDRVSFAYIQNTIAKTQAWLQFKYLDGLEGLASVYKAVCAGENDPSEGLIIKL